MKFGTKLKLKKDWKLNDVITIEKDDILKVAEYKHKYGMKLHIKGVELIDFVFGWNDRDERINEYFEILEDEKYWYVGQVKTYIKNVPSNWEIQGIYSDKQKAIDSCINEHYFVSSIDINKPLPDHTIERKDFNDIAWYPLLENEPNK